jgi:hypothetical protein
MVPKPFCALKPVFWLVVPERLPCVGVPVVPWRVEGVVMPAVEVVGVVVPADDV